MTLRPGDFVQDVQVANRGGAGRVHLGESADVLRARIAPRTIDMIYVDPPFFTQREWIGRAGRFSDRWAFDAAAARRQQQAPSLVRSVLEAATGDDRNLLSYLFAMHELLSAAWSRLRGTGSLWLHCDDSASAHLRLVLDLVFGAARYWGAVTWKRSNGHNTVGRRFARVHDSIIVYARTGAALARLRPATGLLRECPGARCEIDGMPGFRVQGYLEDRLASTSRERVGYPTQKPVTLLSRLIETATLGGDTVLDPCCGSGSTLVAASRLGRAAIGIDRSPDAVALAISRLQVAEAA